MNWSSHAIFFRKERERLSSRVITLTLQDFIESLGLDGVSAADEAIRCFALTMEWPPISERVRFEVCLRLSCAQSYCLDMVGFDADVDDRDGSEFLTELLIDYWRDVGRIDWIYEGFVIPNEGGQP